MHMAASLGGHLVVAFIAPVSAGRASATAPASLPSTSADVQAASARALVDDLIDEAARQRRARKTESTDRHDEPGGATTRA
jgi:hypothetical protein